MPVDDFLNKLEQEKNRNSDERATSWDQDLSNAFNSVIASVRFNQRDSLQAQGQELPRRQLFMTLNESIMEYTSELCNACNNEATNQSRVSEMLFDSNAAEDRTAFKPFTTIPVASDLTFATRLLHDTYLFIHIICCILGALMLKLQAYPPPSSAQVLKKTLDID